MFESFYQLKENPFAAASDSRFVFLAPPHRTALMMLEDMLAGEPPVCLVTGPAGAGKTTLIRLLLTRIRRPTNVGMIGEFDPESSMLRLVCKSFELEADKRESRLLKRLKHFVVDEQALNHKVLLIVDDAERLSPTQLKALAELSADVNRKILLLQVILVGQRPLRGEVGSPHQFKLAGLVAADCDLGELSAIDTRRYIYHRLRVAGGRLSTFTETAILRIHEASGGLPRVINHYCELGLMAGANAGAEVVNTQMMMDVIQEQKSRLAMAS